MAYPERKPIYAAYKKIVQDIIDSKYYKEYAEGEIDALNQSILSTFREISLGMVFNTDWNKKKT